jgi:hypothetical protein
VLLRSRRARLELPRKILAGAIRIAKVGERTKDDLSLPSGLLGEELRGMLHGPWLYLQSRFRLRRSAGRTPERAG